MGDTLGTFRSLAVSSPYAHRIPFIDNIWTHSDITYCPAMTCRKPTVENHHRRHSSLSISVTFCSLVTCDPIGTASFPFALALAAGLFMTWRTTAQGQ